MGALDVIRARLAAQKTAAAQQPTSAEAGVSHHVRQPNGAITPATLPANTAPTKPTVQSSAGHSDSGQPTEAAEHPSLAGLSGIQLMLAKRRLAEQQPAPTVARTSGVSSGQAVGQVGRSVKTEVTVTQTASPALAQQVLTPAQRAIQMAQEKLAKREEAGFYNVRDADKLPQELPADVVAEKLRNLDAALELRTPDLPVLLIEINKNLRQYDELAYCLTDDQLGLIVQSNLSVKSVELTKQKITTKGGKVKADALAQLDVDDMF
jgi:hypothetical protein